MGFRGMWAAGESVLSIRPPEVGSLLRSSSCLVVFVFFLVFRAGLITTCTEEAELQDCSATGCSSSPLWVLLSLFFCLFVCFQTHTALAV